MRTDIASFSGPDGLALRTVIGTDGEPWFVAKDVCDDLDLGNVTNALRSLDADEKAEVTISKDSSGQARRMVILSEPGLYKLIMRSRKPKAKLFSRWVTHEVLPSIRKTGSYSTGPSLNEKALELMFGTLERITARLDRIESTGAAIQAGAVARHQSKDIKRRINAAAVLDASMGRHKSANSARPTIDSRVRESCDWPRSRKGSAWTGLPASSYPLADLALKTIEGDLDKHRKTMAPKDNVRQLTFPSPD